MAAKTISVAQVFELLSKLAASTDWNGVDSAQVQALIDNPREVGRQFTMFVRGHGRVVVAPRDFPIWKTIKLGVECVGSKNPANMIENSGVRFGWGVKDALDKPIFKMGETEQSVDLVRVTVAELGLKSLTEYDMVCAIAQELGLELCPAEVGLQLCFQCSEQLPAKKSITVAMKPVWLHGQSHLFNVVRSDDGVYLDLRAYYGGSLCHPDSAFVFVRRK